MREGASVDSPKNASVAASDERDRRRRGLSRLAPDPPAAAGRAPAVPPNRQRTVQRAHIGAGVATLAGRIRLRSVSTRRLLVPVIGRRWPIGARRLLITTRGRPVCPPVCPWRLPIGGRRPPVP